MTCNKRPSRLVSRAPVVTIVLLRPELNMLTIYDIAQEAMGKFSIEKDIAQHIKRTVRKPGPLYGHTMLTTTIVRRPKGPNLALYRWPQLWQLCDARDQALYLLLSRPLRHSALQDPVTARKAHRLSGCGAKTFYDITIMAVTSNSQICQSRTFNYFVFKKET